MQNYYCWHAVRALWLFPPASITAHVLFPLHPDSARVLQTLEVSILQHPHTRCAFFCIGRRLRERERGRGRTPRNGNLRRASSVTEIGNFDDLTVKPMETWGWCSSPWWWIRLSACPAMLSLCSSHNRLLIHFSSQVATSAFVIEHLSPREELWRKRDAFFQ